jgi:mannose/fructose/N-acetylgalactosamine-specific phosphotransferase system component IIB
MPIVLARVDQRFIHGQILASPALASRRVNGVIVADGDLCRDEVRKGIFDGALTAADPPLSGGAIYVEPKALAALLREKDSSGRRFLVIFGDTGGALAALSAGVAMESLNLGNYCPRSEPSRELFQGFRAGPAEIGELDEISRLVSRVYFGPLDASLMRYRPAPRPGPGGRR